MNLLTWLRYQLAATPKPKPSLCACERCQVPANFTYQGITHLPGGRTMLDNRDRAHFKAELRGEL